MTQHHLKRVYELALRIFGGKTPIIMVGDTPVCIHHGRMYVLDAEQDCLNLVALNLQHGLEYFFRAVPEPIREKNDILKAAQSADRLVVDIADSVTQPPAAPHFGFDLEDKFVKICCNLGFIPDASSKASLYRIRRGTIHEDRHLTTDFVLTVPGGSRLDPDSSEAKIPLQLSGGRRITARKNELAKSGQIAHVALKRMGVSPQRITKLYEKAARGDDQYALWYAGEFIRLACERYLGRPMILPLQPEFRPEFMTSEYRDTFEKYWSRPVRRVAGVVTTQPGLEDRFLRLGETFQGFMRKGKTPYELDLEKIKHW